MFRIKGNCLLVIELWTFSFLSLMFRSAGQRHSVFKEGSGAEARRAYSRD